MRWRSKRGERDVEKLQLVCGKVRGKKWKSCTSLAVEEASTCVTNSTRPHVGHLCTWTLSKAQSFRKIEVLIGFSIQLTDLSACNSFMKLASAAREPTTAAVLLLGVSLLCAPCAHFKRKWNLLKLICHFNGITAPSRNIPSSTFNWNLLISLIFQSKKQRDTQPKMEKEKGCEREREGDSYSSYTCTLPASWP